MQSQTVQAGVSVSGSVLAPALLLTSGSGGSALPGAPTTTPWCRPLSLGATAGAPGDREAVSGLPSGQETVYVLVNVPGMDAEVQAVIMSTVSENDLLVPIHPVDTVRGGPVEFDVTPKTRLSRAFDELFMLNAVPALAADRNLLARTSAA